MTTPIEKIYKEKHSKSEQKFKEAMNLFPNGVTHDARMTKPFPYYITNAQGSKKWDIDGNFSWNIGKNINEEENG